MKKSLSIIKVSAMTLILTVVVGLSLRSISAGGAPTIALSSNNAYSTIFVDAYPVNAFLCPDPGPFTIAQVKLRADQLSGGPSIDFSQATMIVEVDGIPVSGSVISSQTNEIVWQPADIFLLNKYSNDRVLAQNVHTLAAGTIGLSVNFIQPDGNACAGYSYTNTSFVLPWRQTIVGGPSPSPSPAPSPSPTPTPTPTPIPSPPPSPSPSPVPTPSPSAPPIAPISFFSVGGTNATKTTADITWITSAPGTTRVIYGLKANDLNLSTSENSSLIISHTQAISGLKKNSTYYFKVVSKNAAGSEYTSTIYSVKTSK